MIFQRKFREFDFQKFLDFVRDLLTRYNLGYIKFYPYQGKEFFDDYQLTHVAPEWDVNNKRGFIWVWIKKQEVVRTVTYDQFDRENTKKITITIDLDQKSITFDKIENLSAAGIEDSLDKYFENKHGSSWISNKYVNFLFSYTKQIILGILITLIAAYLIFKFGWN